MAKLGNPKGFDYSQLKDTLVSTRSDKELFEFIVNAPFQYKVQCNLLFLGIIVFLQVNKKTKTIDRVALSKTQLAEYTKEMSAKRFEEIKIPLKDPENIIAKAIRTGKLQDTTDWKYLFTPELTSQEARLNQAGGSIAYSAVHPLKSRDGGALIFSYFDYPKEIGDSMLEFMKKYSQIVDRALKFKRPPKFLP